MQLQTCILVDWRETDIGHKWLPTNLQSYAVISNCDKKRLPLSMEGILMGTNISYAFS